MPAVLMNRIMIIPAVMITVFAAIIMVDLASPVNLSSALEEVRAAGFTVFAAGDVPTDTPTFLVCSSTALANSCDFRADGTEDEVQIQSAISGCPASGCRVVLSEGAFNLTTGIIMIDGLFLEGQGYSTSLNLPVIGNTLSAVSVSNLTIKHLRIVGNPAVGNNVGVRFSNVTDSIVDNIWVEDVGFDGIQLISGNSRITVSNSFVDNAQDDGINIGGSTAPATTDIVITDNHITNSGAVGIHGSWGASFVSIVANTVEGTGTHGIDVNLENNGAKHTTIVGNSIRNTGAHGLAVTGPSDISDVIISENVIDLVGDSGIRISNNGATRWIVSDNLITNATTRGIIISQSAPAANRDFIITNNIINGGVTNQGINLFEVNNALILGNIVTGIGGLNSIDMNGGSSDNYVIGNKVDGNISSPNSNAVRNNMGWITESFGTATILSGNTSIVVNHGLSVTPVQGNCSFIGAEDPTNSPGAHWINTFTSTQITLNVENDPGASNYDVAWTCTVY